eukprot:6772446-Prymnesium_polylepis.1
MVPASFSCKLTTLVTKSIREYGTDTGRIRDGYAPNTHRIRKWIRTDTHRIRKWIRTDTQDTRIRTGYARMRTDTHEYARIRTDTQNLNGYARVRTGTHVPYVRMDLVTSVVSSPIEEHLSLV